METSRQNNYGHRVGDYVNGVLDGSIVACKWVKLACERYMKDRRTGPERGLSFDEDEAARVAGFFETHLFHTTGRWAAQRWELAPWQLFILWNLFGFKRPDGTRRFRISLVECARKQGKSCLAAGIGNYMTLADREPRAETYSASTKKDQSKIVFEEAQRMVRASSDLKRFAKVLTHNISVPENYSKFEPLGADTDTLDGLNIHCALVDEVHAHKSRNLWDVLVTATGARRQPLVFAITTAGYDRTTLLAELDDYGRQLLEGTIEDDGFFFFLATLDEGDDWQDEANWPKANPNLCISVFPEDMREECERAKKTPSAMNAFLRYRMNMWTQTEMAWLTHEQWALNNHYPVSMKRLKGRLCYAGLDLAAKRDTTSLVLVFPPEKEGRPYDILPFIFVPEDSIFEREKIERVPWTSWKSEKLIFTTPGPVTDTRFVLKKLGELDKQFQISDLIYDRWGMDLVVPLLREMRWADSKDDPEAERFLIEMGQGWKSMSPATKLLEEMAINGQLNHGGHKVLAWMMSNVALKTDDAENVHPSKKRSTGRIDAVIALLMALWRAKGAEVQEEKPRSKYEEDGAGLFYIEDPRWRKTQGEKLIDDIRD